MNMEKENFTQNVETADTLTPETPAQSATSRFVNEYRKGLLTALTALSILGGAQDAFADDSQKSPTKTAPKVARIEGKDGNHQDVVRPVKTEEQPNLKEKKEELKHHTFKAGTILGIAKHPSGGFEGTYSWTPSVDPSSKLHFVLTPVDFMVSQHHLQMEETGHHSTATRPRFFVGSLVGFSYLFNKFLEFEAGVGGGAAFIPYGSIGNGQNYYQPTPVLKIDTQLDVIFDHINHVGAYIGYSPELNIGAPHLTTKEGVEKKTVIEHIMSLGLRKDF